MDSHGWWQWLARADNVVTAAFCAGFFSAFQLRRRTLRAPLPSLFGSAVAGAMAVLVAFMACLLIPDPFVPFVTLVCAASAVNRIADDLLNWR